MDIELDPSIVPESFPPVPKLVPVFFINLKLEEPDCVFTNKSLNKSLSLAKIANGEITTIENELGYGIEVRDIHGLDDISSNLETGESVSDCKLYGKTLEGSGVYVTYEAMFRFSDKTLKVLGRQEDFLDFDDAFISCLPRIQFDDSVDESMKWAWKETLIGKGRFLRDKGKNLCVQYVVYVIK